ncbi:Peptidase family M50 [Crateriforma conspicua]|uniref:Peptidase family M50 n=2 Tax=Crateriforma conspicua TaxID=2527996 RepID=A0A5C5XUL2_9PLAN|nr:Peptidase family M50 [Crateriforma conspicua]TWT65715.1 Peptidase family M50 [Crateriforma conspicua]
MLLQQPAESPYDLRFQLFGFPIRVAWTFWIGAVVFGYGLADMVDQLFQDSSPGRFPLLLLWAVCLLVSIIIHELGHALAFRTLGIESSIVLYHFGGLAIPRSGPATGGGFEFAPVTRLSPSQDLFIAASGPLLQIASAMVLAVGLKAAGYGVAAFGIIPGFNRIEWLQEGQPLATVGMFSIALFYILPSVLWALFNLLPVYPLDGGRVARAIIQLAGGQIEQSLWLSLVVAVLMAVWGLQSGEIFITLLFASLAMGNYQMLQQYGGRF